jgi:hypothetical protein
VEPPVDDLLNLRQIGWAHWDPIGLRQISGDDWKDGGACADEYDLYLVHAAGMLRGGHPVSRVTDYLVFTETERIGMTQNTSTRSRAEATALAIRDYLDGLTKGD